MPLAKVTKGFEKALNDLLKEFYFQGLKVEAISYTDGLTKSVLVVEESKLSYSKKKKKKKQLIMKACLECSFPVKDSNVSSYCHLHRKYHEEFLPVEPETPKNSGNESASQGHNCEEI